MNDHQQLQAATEGWPVQRLTTGDGVAKWCLKRGAADQTDTEVQCREYLGRQWLPVKTWCVQVHATSENWQECHQWCGQKVAVQQLMQEYNIVARSRTTVVGPVLEITSSWFQGVFFSVKTCRNSNSILLRCCFVNWKSRAQNKGCYKWWVVFTKIKAIRTNTHCIILLYSDMCNASVTIFPCKTVSGCVAHCWRHSHLRTFISLSLAQQH